MQRVRHPVARGRFDDLAIRLALLLSMLLPLTQSSCRNGSGPFSGSGGQLQTVEGLERVELPIPGVLELRPHHGIGSYDALLIPRSRLSYKRGSLRLTREAEEIFLGILRDTLVKASTAAVIPIVEEPGPCVMQINLDVIGMNLDTADDALQLAEMTVVMQFRDAESQEMLLRFATENRVPSPEEGVTPNAQIRRGLTRIVKKMDLAGPMRSAGLADDEIDPACGGLLAERGRAANARR